MHTSYLVELEAHCLLVSSSHNLCKQIGPRSDPTTRGAWSRSNLFDTWMVFLKEFFEKVYFENDKKARKNPRGQRVKFGPALRLCHNFVQAGRSGETVGVPRIVGALAARIYAYLSEVFYIMLKRNINVVNDFNSHYLQLHCWLVKALIEHLWHLICFFPDLLETMAGPVSLIGSMEHTTLLFWKASSTREIAQFYQWQRCSSWDNKENNTLQKPFPVN